MSASRKLWTPEEIERVVTLRRTGQGWRAIARLLGRQDTVCRYQYERKTGEKTQRLSVKKTFKYFQCDNRSEQKSDRPSLPPGHPVIMRGLWRGLEHWRGFADEQ